MSSKPLYELSQNPYGGRQDLYVRVDDDTVVLINNNWLLDHAKQVHSGEVHKKCFNCGLPIGCQCGPTRCEERILDLEEEITTLRYFGNKDCTAQADEAIARNKRNRGEQ